jgi:hypothetical protein
MGFFFRRLTMSPAFVRGFAEQCKQLGLGPEQADYLYVKAASEIQKQAEAPVGGPPPGAGGAGGIDPAMLQQLEQLLQQHPELLQQLMAQAGGGAGGPPPGAGGPPQG